MRANIYILLIALFATSSCNTVQKMVDQGRYDEAFTYSIKNLAGKKNKKTKYVLALEEAYIRLNERNLNEISFMMKRGAPASWDRVIHVYEKLDRRQNLIKSISPLEAKNGYIAHFEQRDYSDNIIEAMELSAEYHYSNAIKHAIKARSGDKRAARRGMTSLNQIDKYYSEYKDASNLREEIHSLGIENISIEIVNNGDRYYGEQAMDHLYNINISQLNSFWVNFDRYDPAKEYDNYVVIELSNIYLGSERESVNRNSYSKEIEDGFDIIEEKKRVKVEEPAKQVTSKDGQIELSKPKEKYITQVTTTTVPKFKTISARTTEIRREKLGDIKGMVRIYRNGDEMPYYQKNITSNFNFQDEAIEISGDVRAIPCVSGKSFIDAFPSDFYMVDELAYSFSNAASHEINKYDFLYNTK